MERTGRSVSPGAGCRDARQSQCVSSDSRHATSNRTAVRIIPQRYLRTESAGWLGEQRPPQARLTRLTRAMSSADGNSSVTDRIAAAISMSEIRFG